MRKLRSKLLNLLLSGALLMPQSAMMSTAHAAAEQPVPELLITELMPDPTPPAGKTSGDGHEFIEIYNASNHPVPIKDYKIVYAYPDSTPSKDWDLVEDKVLAPNSTMVIWVKTKDSEGLELAQFNSHYEASLREDQLTFVNSDGMYNRGERTLIIAKDNGEEISSAQYLGSDIVQGKSINFQPPADGTSRMFKMGGNQVATPGILVEGQTPVLDQEPQVLLSESFDEIPDGQLPVGMDVYYGKGSWSVENGKLVGQAPSGSNTRLLFGNSSWDNYTVEADVYFASAVNSARWTSLMFRASENGNNDYYQFALRQNGTAEIAYRTPANSWAVFHSKPGTALPLGSVHKMKVNVYGQYVQEFLDGQLLFDEKAITQRSSGKAGLQVDQSKVVFDNVKVTELKADHLELPEKMELEALSGPAALTGKLVLSDGHAMNLPADKVTWRSSNEQLARIENGSVYPLRPGDVEITASYEGMEESFILTVLPTDKQAQILEIQPQQKYLIMQQGQQSVQLNVTARYSDDTEKDISSLMTWSSDNEHVVKVDKGLVTPAGAGKAKLTAEINGMKAEIPVKVTEAGADTKLWIEENFDSLTDGSLPAEWTVMEGTYKVENGSLTLSSPSSASPARVRIPMDVRTGDYIFEADVTFRSVVEDTRWTSLMYRIQPQGYPYYQFAVRRGTSAHNGLEFAIRNQSNQWEVPDKTFYHENFQLNKPYHIKVIVSGSRVQQFVNGEMVINNNLAAQYREGDLGFQANGATVQFDNVRISLDPGELPPIKEFNAFQPQEPATGIVNPPTVIVDAYSALSNVEQFAGTGVSSIVLPVAKTDQGLVVQNGAGAVSSLRDALLALESKLIPILKIEEQGVVGDVISLLKDMQLEDVHLLSSQPGIIKQARAEYPKVRGAIEFNVQDLNDQMLKQIAASVHGHDASVAVLPQDALSPEAVSVLQKNYVSVWGKGAATLKSSHELIHDGVNGAIVSSPEPMLAALRQYPGNTLHHIPFVVSHRGVPNLAPENTLASYRKAMELGGDIIETDVQMTADGELVIMHDTTVDRTTNGTGKVSDLTLEQIRRLDAGSKFSPEFAGEKVPTFRELLQLLKGTDIYLLAEAKQQGIQSKMIEMIEQEGMSAQVNVQSFDHNFVKTYHQLRPETPTAFLESGSVPASKPYNQAHKTMQTNLMSNTIYAPSYTSVYPELLRYGHARGVLFTPWTFRSDEALKQHIGMGIDGIITDLTDHVGHAPIRIEAKTKEYVMQVGEKLPIEAISYYRRGVEQTITPALMAVENGSLVNIQGNEVEALSPGKVIVLAKHTFPMAGGEWNRFSAPIEITIVEKGELTLSGPDMVYPNSRFTLNIDLNKVNDLYGASVNLQYDPSQLQVIDADSAEPGLQIQPGSLLTGAKIKNEVNQEQGYITFAATELGEKNGVDGQGTLATVTFKVLAGTAGSSIEVKPAGSIKLADSQNNEINVSMSPFKTEIRIPKTEVKGSVVLPATHHLQNLSGFTVRLMKGSHVLAQDETKADGTYTLFADEIGDFVIEIRKDGYQTAKETVTVAQEGQVTVSPLKLYVGDFNGDELINIEDILKMAKAYEKEPIGEYEIYNVDKNEVIDIHDVIAVARNFGIEPDSLDPPSGI